MSTFSEKVRAIKEAEKSRKKELEQKRRKRENDEISVWKNAVSIAQRNIQKLSSEDKGFKQFLKEHFNFDDGHLMILDEQPYRVSKLNEKDYVGYYRLQMDRDLKLSIVGGSSKSIKGNRIAYSTLITYGYAHDEQIINILSILRELETKDGVTDFFIKKFMKP